MREYEGQSGSEEFARAEMRTSAARLIHQQGFSHSNESSLEILAEIMRRYMQRMCAQAHFISEHCGRTNVSLGDMQYVYRKMHVDVDEMNIFFQQNRPMTPRPVPRFPVAKKKTRRTTSLSQKAAACPERPEHIPPWAPALNRHWFKNAAPAPPVVEAGEASSSKIDFEQRVAPFPDFSAESAITLGLVRLKKEPEPERIQAGRVSAMSRPSSRANSRPPSRDVLGRAVPDLSQTYTSHDLLAMEASSSRPPSSMSGTSTASSSQNRKKDVKLGKRKLDELNITIRDDVVGHSSASPSPNLMANLQRQSLLNQTIHSIQDAIRRNEANAAQAASTSKSKVPTSAELLNTLLAADLLRNPARSMAEVISGRAAPPSRNPAAVRPGLPPIPQQQQAPPTPAPARPPPLPRSAPRTVANISDPPAATDSPTRIMQLHLLKSLFTAEGQALRQGPELQKVLDNIKQGLVPKLAAVLKQHQQAGAAAAAAAAGRGVVQAVAVPVNQPLEVKTDMNTTLDAEYRVVTSSETIPPEGAKPGALPPIKLKITRRLSDPKDGISAPSPAISVASSTTVDNSDDGFERRRKHKKKKKKKRHRMEDDEEEEDSYSGFNGSATYPGSIFDPTEPSPCETSIDGDGIIKLTIRRRNLSRPPSGQP